MFLALCGGDASAQEAETRRGALEIGLGLALVDTPDYPGSERRQLRLLPIPFLVYEGRWLRADREGLRLISGSRLRLELSFDGAPPVDSAAGTIRDGMEERLPLLELGPAVRFILFDRADQKLALRASFRPAIGCDLQHLRYLGHTVAPELRYDGRFVTHRSELNFAISIGPLFRSEGMHDYYYDVAAPDVRVWRPSYDAPGGYSGVRLLVTARLRVSSIWLGSFLRFEEVGSAVFSQSPLIETPGALTAGIGLAWVFSRPQAARLTVRPRPEDRRRTADRRASEILP
jgi:hypothetical protein